MSQNNSKINLSEVAKHLSDLTNKRWNYRAPFVGRDCPRDKTYWPELYYIDEENNARTITVYPGGTGRCKAGREQLYGSSTIGPIGKAVSVYSWMPDVKTDITVADSRSPEAIAKDINRRLIPAWEKALDKAIAAYKLSVNRENVKRELAERLSKIVNGEVVECRSEGVDYIRGIRTRDRYIYRLEIESDLTTHLELRSLPQEKISQILEIVAA